jgi:transcriptional regulator with XRE-family HTH domain
MIRNILREKNMTIYQLAKESGIPYATANDICNGKTRLEKCTAETVYKIARTLNTSMEELLAPCFFQRSSFENFKSAICHKVKEMGDIDFIIDTLESDAIRTYYNRKWYPESLYLLAMVDYLSRLNDVPIDSEYDDLRRRKLEKTVYPSSLRAMSVAVKDNTVLKEAEKAAIPEFLRFNIVESEVRNVV